MTPLPLSFLFFFNDTATTEIYTLSLHDALPISFERQNAADLPASDEQIACPPDVAPKGHAFAERKRICITENKDMRNIEIASAVIRLDVVRVLNTARLSFVLNGQATRPGVGTEKCEVVRKPLL